MDAKKPTYRNIVCEEVLEKQEVVLTFKEWNEISPVLDTLGSTKHQKPTGAPNTVKLNFLDDFADFITQLTADIKDYYGFHGVANDISVPKVMECFQQSVVIDINDDNSNNENSSDDDETFS